MRKSIVILFVGILMLSSLVGCSKTTTERESPISEPPSGTPSPILQNMGIVEIDVEDAPPSIINVDHLLVTLNNIQIHESAGLWVSMPNGAIPFDLISIGENAQLFTSQTMVATDYNEIRFGITAISVVVGNNTYKASVPSGTINLVGNFDIANGRTTVVVLDFEADQSLYLTGDNEYSFKPVVDFRTPKPGGVLGITTPSLDNVLEGLVERDKVSVSGGKKPYMFSVTSGSLPPGVTLNLSSGRLEGTPTQDGTYSFVIQVTDSSSPSQTDTASYIIRVASANSIVVTTTNLPNGIVSEPYDVYLFGYGGSGIYSWSIIGGSLPPGLLLDVVYGSIDGLPTEGGTYSFVLQAQDTSNPTLIDTQTLIIVVQ